MAVPVVGDTLDEINETFTLGLSNPTNSTIADGSATGTITDDDPLPGLSVSDPTVTEGNAGTVNAVFTVTLAPASGRPVTADYATTAGTATTPADFTAATGSLTFAPGETTKTVSVQVKGDTLDEVDEVFTLNLSNVGNAALADGIGQATITDDDAAPTISIGDATVTEGNSGTVNATFTVGLSAASGKALSVQFGTANGTATVAGNDYEAANGTLNFAVGETTKQVVVVVNGDVTDESDETFTVNLSSPVNVTIADAVGTGTITDDDGTPSVSRDDVVAQV